MVGDAPPQWHMPHTSVHISNCCRTLDGTMQGSGQEQPLLAAAVYSNLLRAPGCPVCSVGSLCNLKTWCMNISSGTAALRSCMKAKTVRVVFLRYNEAVC